MTIPLDAPIATTISMMATSKDAKAAARIVGIPLLTISSHSRGTGVTPPGSIVIKRSGDDFVTASTRQIRRVRSYSITAIIELLDARIVPRTWR